ncbi:MAG: phosphopyruvate hydratase [Spirochaetales bacterium]|nr:phosphopyruvate hydratase [Spirochaetales bacterium]
MASRIKSIHAREVFDTKGLPTVEVSMLLEDGSSGLAAAPGGTSRGSSEPFDLRDGDQSYFNGMGVGKAIHNVNTEIAGRLKGMDAADQDAIDRALLELDGTGNKSRLGGNAVIATSLANAKAAAGARGVELFEHLGGGTEIPVSLANIMYGGPAYVGVAGTADFQEYKLYALSAAGPKDGYLRISRIYERLREMTVRNQGFGIPRLAQLAGGLAARFDSNEEPFAAVTALIEEEGYIPGKDFGFYIDMAATQLYEDGKYHLRADNQVLSREEWIGRIVDLCNRYPIISMEDCLHEDDWDGWVELTKRLGDRVQLVGDDLFTTNPVRLRKGIDMGAANAVVIKPNQVGTLTETFETIRIAKAAGYGTIVSGRSGELWDPYIAHLCVGQSLGQGKMVNCPAGGQHLNELMRIQDHLGGRAVYVGRSALAKFL